MGKAITGAVAEGDARGLSALRNILPELAATVAAAESADGIAIGGAELFAALDDLADKLGVE